MYKIVTVCVCPAATTGWTVGSLHLQVTIGGREVVAPSLRLLSRPSSPASDAMDAIIGTYTMTVAGSYNMEMRLLGWCVIS